MFSPANRVFIYHKLDGRERDARVVLSLKAGVPAWGGLLSRRVYCPRRTILAKAPRVVGQESFCSKGRRLRLPRQRNDLIPIVILRAVKRRICLGIKLSIFESVSVGTKHYLITQTLCIFNCITFSCAGNNLFF